MQCITIVTGAAGHLGNTLIRQLSLSGETVRGLIMPGETGLPMPNVTYVQGDVRKPETLEPLFQNTADMRMIVIHAAGIVSIADKVTDALREVNVGGTRNIISLCQRFGVQKLVYVSTVHALPTRDAFQVIAEEEHFSADVVHGGYAKTKAEATQLVLDAGLEGLNVAVVHPSGIIGPYDTSGNHLVQMIDDFIHGALKAGVRGGYDFVDVRDVALGCLAAANAARSGECYILSNRHYEVGELFDMLRALSAGRRIPLLPMWMARAASPMFTLISRIRNTRPLYTRYALKTLTENDRFSHDKATRELNYTPRDLYVTLKDTVDWVRGDRTLLMA